MPFVTDVALIDAAKLRVAIKGIEKVAGTGLVVEGHLRFPRVAALFIGIVLAGEKGMRTRATVVTVVLLHRCVIYFFCCNFLNPCKIFKRKDRINGQNLKIK